MVSLILSAVKAGLRKFEYWRNMEHNIAVFFFVCKCESTLSSVSQRWFKKSRWGISGKGTWNLKSTMWKQHGASRLAAKRKIPSNKFPFQISYLWIKNCCRDQKSYAAKSLRLYMWSQHMYMECSTKTYRYLANRFAKESIFENITQFFYRMPNFLYYAKLYLRIYSPTDNQWGQYLFTIQVLACVYTLSSVRHVLRFTRRLLDTTKPYSLFVTYYH